MKSEIHKWRVVDEGDLVVIGVDDRHCFRLDWKSALRLGQAIQSRAKNAEQVAKRERIIRDGAMLQRAGWRGAGVTDNSKIQDRIGIEAAHDRDLRRYMPGGVKGQYRIGLGRIIQGPPPDETES